jgi:hypothetical protein
MAIPRGVRDGEADEPTNDHNIQQALRCPKGETQYGLVPLKNMPMMHVSIAGANVEESDARDARAVATLKTDPRRIRHKRTVASQG